MQRVTRKQKIGTALRRMRLRFFPPVSRRKAAEIARQNCSSPDAELEILPAKPSTLIYHSFPTEPCWFFYAPWEDGRPWMLRSSRMILVSKETGKVVYDGDARDEG